MPETPGLIQGHEPESIQEWRLAVALDHYEIPYRYQIPIFGGTRIAGGQVVDFLVLQPFTQPVQVFGRYWHKGQLDPNESFNLQAIEQYFGIDVIVFWENDLETQAEAFRAVREKIL